MLTIGDEIVAVQTTAAAVTDDTSVVAAANAKLAADTTAASDASATLKTDLPKVGGAAFAPDGKTVYLSDASTTGYHTVAPVAAVTEVPTPPPPPPTPG